MLILRISRRTLIISLFLAVLFIYLFGTFLLRSIVWSYIEIGSYLENEAKGKNCRLLTNPLALLRNNNSIVLLIFGHHACKNITLRWSENNNIQASENQDAYVHLANKKWLGNDVQGYVVALHPKEQKNNVEYHLDEFDFGKTVNLWSGKFCSYQQPSPILLDSHEEVVILSGIVSDNQSGNYNFLWIMNNLMKLKPQVMIHIGDSKQNSRGPIKEWFKDFFYPWDYSMNKESECITPIISARGNHDPFLPMEDLVEQASPLVLNGQKITGEYYFTIIGDILWVVLNSNEKSAQQKNWFESILEQYKNGTFVNACWLMVAVHMPPFGEYWDPRAWVDLHEKHWPDEITFTYVPLFEKYGVDVVWCGHQHNYQRSNKVNGVQYIIIGGAGGGLDYDRVENHAINNKTVIKHHFAFMESSYSSHHKMERKTFFSVKVFDIRGNLVDLFGESKVVYK